MNPFDFIKRRLEFRPEYLEIRWRILAILRNGPATCEEIEDATGLKHQTASPRVHELGKWCRWCGVKLSICECTRHQPWIEKTGEQRPTRSGCMADVWRITKQEG